MTNVAPIFGLDRSQYIEAVTGFLLDELKDSTTKTKTAAEWSRAPVATAKHWVDRTSAPEGPYLGRLRATLPEFDAKMAELEGKKRDRAADFLAKLNVFFLNLVAKDPNSPEAQLVFETFFKPQNDEAATKVAAE